MVPLSRTAMVWAFCIVERRWAMVITVRPSMTRSMASWTRYSLSASRALTHGKRRWDLGLDRYIKIIKLTAVPLCTIDIPYVALPVDLWGFYCEYSTVTMIVPASGHQIHCIPWVEMATFNKEIGFLCGLKFFASNIFCGEYLQWSLHLMLQIWWKLLLWKMCQ